MSEKEKLLTAYHEGGHTLVGLETPETDPVHKATILPRGGALGVTWSIPKEERCAAATPAKIRCFCPRC